MAYKRTTSTRKSGDTTYRTTETFNNKTGKWTVRNSQSRKHGNTTSTHSWGTNGEFFTRTENGWVTKKKLFATPKKKTRSSRSSNNDISNIIIQNPILIIIAVIIFMLF